MKDYLTISEFARLRNVNINSLLYYERLGILLPAFVDPDSKYRYYAPEQLSTLDIIQMCIKLDIPLKELKQYQQEDAYWQKKMLEDGRRIAEDKIHRLQTDLKKIEYSLKCQEEQDDFASCKGIYQREIAARFLLWRNISGSWRISPSLGAYPQAFLPMPRARDFPSCCPRALCLSLAGTRSGSIYFMKSCQRKGRTRRSSKYQGAFTPVCRSGLTRIWIIFRF